MSNKNWDIISYNQQMAFNKHSVIWGAADDKQVQECYEEWVLKHGLRVKPCDPDCKCDNEKGCCDDSCAS